MGADVLQLKTKPIETDESILRRQAFNQKADELTMLGKIPARIEWVEDELNIGWVDDFEIILPPEAWEAYGTSPYNFQITPSLTDAIGKVKAALKVERGKYINEVLSKKAESISTFDANNLTPPYKHVVAKLLENIPVHERLYEKQLNPRAAELRAKVEGEGFENATKLMNRTSEANCSFFGSSEFLGPDFYKCALIDEYPIQTYFSGMWPEGMSMSLLDELNAFKNKENPFTSPWTSVYWSDKEKGEVSWRTYAQDPLFAKDIKLAAKIFEEAAAIGKEENKKAGKEVVDKGFIKQLESLATAYLSTDPYPFKQSYIDRINAGGPVTLTAGPFESDYEDEKVFYEDDGNGNLGINVEKYHKKAAFQMILGFKDEPVSKRLKEMSTYTPQLDAALAKLIERKKGPGIYAGRDFSKFTAKGTPFIQSIAVAGDVESARAVAISHALPNMYYDEIGSWIESFSVALRAKARTILTKIADEVIPEEQRSYVNEQSFIETVNWHEIGHTIGPARDKEYTFTYNGETKTVTPGKALGEMGSVIEEAKADACMIWASGFVNGQLSQKYLEDLATSTACLVRSSRFGVGDSHGEANSIRFGYYIAHGAMKVDEDGTIIVDSNKIYSVNEDLLAELVFAEATGNTYKTVEELKTKYLELGKSAIEAAANKVNAANIPIDIEIEYKVENLN